MPPAEISYRASIDEAIRRAAEILDFDDIDDDADEEEFHRAHDERFHCGHCTVRVVMEIVWPEVEKYVAFLSTLAYGEPSGE